MYEFLFCVPQCIIFFREQQKSDAKDLKVLNILQQKDNQIKILEDVNIMIIANGCIKISVCHGSNHFKG